MEFESFWAKFGLLGGEFAWITQAFLVVFGSLLLAYFQKKLLAKIHHRLTQTSSVWDDAIVDAVRKPATAVIWLVGITFAAQILGKETDTPLFDIAQPIRDVGVIACISWFLLRLIERAQKNILNERRAKGRTVDLTTADAVSKLLRLSVIITSIMVALQTLGFSVQGVLAFGGVGGIAIGFAARDLLANFFGGLMIYMDRPFAVGDWVRSPDKEIEGTVEEIGWRLTRIRTFDQRPLYVPNATFTTISLENPSRMSNRRIFETIGVRYDDAGRLKGILEDIRRMLKENESIDQNRLLMVNFNQYGPSSLDFFIYCFTKTTVWSEFHVIKEDVLFRIMDIILAHGAEVAFPTTTVHVPEGLRMVREEMPEFSFDKIGGRA